MSILRIICFAFFITNYSFSQFYADSVISISVIEFMKIADEETKSLDDQNALWLNRKFTVDEIDLIAKLYYKACEEDPVGFNTYIQNEHNKWTNNRNSLEVKPAMKKHLMIKKIAEKYGIPFTEIIGTPAILRCKFIKFFSSYYNSSDTLIQNRFQAQNFVFIIEDVLKGKKFFNQGDTIAVMMIPDVEDPSPNFISGNSYLVPLTTFLCSDSSDFNIRFNFLKDEYDVWKMGVPPKVFSIQNEIIQNCAYFGVPEMNWNEFKEYFKNTFLIFN